MPYWSNGFSHLYHADARELPLPDQSVHCIVTSPPYWGLRNYGIGDWLGGDSECDHLRNAGDCDVKRHKSSRVSGGIPANENHSQEPWPSGICGRCGAQQDSASSGIGMEPSIQEWVDNLVLVFRECWRVLRNDGTLWLNVGDAYVGSGVRAPHHANPGLSQRARREGCIGRRPSAMAPGLPAKSKLGLPWRLAFALQDDGWILRQDIIWAKKSPMPESTRDRPTVAHEYIFLFSKQGRYFYDLDAIREDSGANARSVWRMTTRTWLPPVGTKHFAQFPEELPRRCIAAGTSDYGVCAKCGTPWARVVKKSGGSTGVDWAKGNTESVRYQSGTSTYRPNADYGQGPYRVELLGWQPGCACSAGVVPATVLDPFVGSGTTVAVAQRLGRRGVGIDLNPEYLDIAARRIEEIPVQLTAEVE